MLQFHAIIGVFSIDGAMKGSMEVCYIDTKVNMGQAVAGPAD